MSAPDVTRAIFVLVGVAYLAYFLPALLIDVRFRLRYRPCTSRTIATCVSILERGAPGVSGRRVTVNQAMLQWNLPDGTCVRAPERAWTKPVRFEIGDKALIYYNPKKPREFFAVRKMTSKDARVRPGIYILTAVVFSDWLVNLFALF